MGDLDPVELEECVLKYLGTVSPEPKVTPLLTHCRIYSAGIRLVFGVLACTWAARFCPQSASFLLGVAAQPVLTQSLLSPPSQVPVPEDPAVRLGRPLAIQQGVPLPQRHMTWHLKDSGGCLRGWRGCPVKCG